mgnify:FL=1
MVKDNYLTDLEKKWAEEDKLIALPETNETLPLLFLPRVMNESVLPRKRTHDKEILRSYRNTSMRVRTIDNGSLPYGVVARKLLLFFSTRAIQDKNRHIKLGMSEREVMNHLGIARNHKSSLNLRNQVRRLSKLTVEVDYRPKGSRRVEYQGVIFSQIVLERDDKQLPFWASEVIFSRDYYDAIGKRANPYNTSQVAGIDGAFAMDLFLWLAIRLPQASREWKSLHVWDLVSQFHFGKITPNTKYVFSKGIQRALQSIYRVWPAAKESVQWNKKTYRLKIRYTGDLVDLKPLPGWKVS